jgi:hypothetical protein
MDGERCRARFGNEDPHPCEPGARVAEFLREIDGKTIAVESLYRMSRIGLGAQEHVSATVGPSDFSHREDAKSAKGIG